MYISNDDKERILSLCDDKIVETITAFGPLRKSGSGYTANCPCCGSENGLSINPSKKVFKCFKCGECQGKTSTSYLMNGHGMDYPTALKWMADHFNIQISDPVRPVRSERCNGEQKESYCSKMLRESGLTKNDVIARVITGDNNHTIFKQATFVPGTVGRDGGVDKTGDDVIIYYYDLEGLPVTYQPKNSKGDKLAGERLYYRVRWQYPDEHKDKAGRPAKYKSPAGAPTCIYIPQYIRALYKSGKEIPRLYIQEGEKKAEKACKHGIPSVAVAGIQNLGVNKQLPESVIKIVETCNVKEVVFLLDSDCFDLTSHIKLNDPIERRPRNFFYAIKNYKEYFETLKNRNLYLELYFGHILKNSNGDKGIDDLLTNTLKGKENLLKEDIERTINLKEKIGEYVQLYKITTYTDSKLQEIWGLNSAQTFCNKYKEVLKDLPEFLYGRHKWRYNEQGELVTAQPLEPEEQFWDENIKTDKNGKSKTDYEFRYVRAFRFLQNRGFGRYPTLNGGYEFIHITPPTVRTIPYWEIRDYLQQFTQDTLKEGILEMLYRGGTQYLGPDKLSNLAYQTPYWEVPQRGSQYLYFKEKFWHITPDAISEATYDKIPHNIWADQKKEFPASLVDKLINVSLSDDGIWNYSLSAIGQKCHFLRFLENASNFTWRKTSEDISLQEKNENAQHLIAKLCALGYLVVSVKDYSAAKAVIGVDGKQSEIGISNGRSGKSLLGELIKRTVVSQYLNGKTIDLSKDQFVWTELTEKTKVVFIDDIRKDFNFELLFANVTGSWTINYKSGGRVTLDFARSPKVYLTTNHSISGDGSSFLDRQWNIAFSDYYSDTHKPVDDFGALFFDEWDYEQWNLTWNLIAQSVQLYFKYGVVESPSERIELRRLRQDLGEEFILWADEYFSNEAHLNNAIPRKDMYDNLLKNVGSSREKFYTPTLFKKKILKYCQFRELFYNPHKMDYRTGLSAKYDKDGRPDMDDKKGGIEYFIIGSSNYYDLNPNIENEVDIFNMEIDYENED
ncbi:MAG: DNA primase [Bacteroidales bacterium]|nr:DNA primase [Bacteroidales bacterium]